MTMQVIQHIELGSAAANITFSSIATDKTDLLLVASLRFDGTSGSAAALPCYISFNGTAYNSARRQLFGNGSSAVSFNGTDGEAGNVPTTTATSNTFGNLQIYIPNYRSSTTKSFSNDIVTENNGTTAVQEILAGLWSGTDPISSITLDAFGTLNFVAGSSATLYGITKGSDGTTTVS